MNPFAPPNNQNDTGKIYIPGLFDIELNESISGIGDFSTKLKINTGHGFIFINNECVFKWWSLNVITDNITFNHSGNEISIKYTWMPIFKSSVFINGTLIKDSIFIKESGKYWIMVIIGNILIVMVLALVFYIFKKLF